MNGFEFSDQTLEDLERVHGARGSGRGRVDRRGNRALGRDLGSLMRAPAQLVSGVARAASRSREDRNARAIEQLGRTAKRAPQVVVKITSRIHGAASTVGAFTYAGRIGMSDQEPIGIETSEGKELMSAHDMMLLAREWHQWETADEARRNGATAIAMVFSMPPGTDPEKVREAVRDYAETDLSNRRWVMALHTDEAHPHVHLIIAGRDNDGRRFNPNREFLQHARERFAENLRDRGVEADATIRMARAYPPKQDPTPVLKMRERGAEPEADKGRLEMIGGQSVGAEQRLGERERARTKTIENHMTVREVYARAAAELEARGGASEAEQARAVRAFIDTMPAPTPARSEIIERLKAGNALPMEYEKDAELERLKARVQQRDADQKTDAMDRIERATAKIKSLSAELKGGDTKAGAGEGEPTTFERIRAMTAELKNDSAPPDLGPDRALAGAHERLLAMQRKMEQSIKERAQNKDRDRSRDRDRDREGPGR
ncbi:hypothetical protein WSK_3505 [Novosphingobium sp. Rr 2-17]|uniref:relaxase/mobilization nuclease domain-containing protein n=1 Tax=Novosphingobium sp. Rr 2-17 TaxID=555793 RepID=UPI000269A21F|nr:relaxase/mobilization nuclease domain-containing protein [Novosphingobium sp. Rr 2-17]EIZ77943.1 hypothetical protein WSK_3505 [Novosphingobium sp. Rr 2-17]